MANRGKMRQIEDVKRSKIVVEIGVFYYRCPCVTLVDLECRGVRGWSTYWKLSDRLPFLFGKACYVFRSENALYGTGHIIGRMMIMKTALLLNTL